MVTLSDAMRRINPSPTVALTGQVAVLRAAGRDVISLGAGEPDFDTPAHIRAVAIRAIEGGETRYTPPDGTRELKEAVAAKFRDENGLDAQPDSVIVSSGGKQSIFNALLATIGPGDEVVIPAPFWVSYPDIVRLTGATPIIVQTEAQNGFRISAEALERALSPATRWIILNSPGNPTGGAYAAEDLAAIAAVLANWPDVMVLSDEIYEHITYDGFKHVSLASAAPELADRVLTLNGVSKAYAMTGWRIGYAHGPVALIRAMRILQGQSTSNASSVSQAAAVAALKGPQDALSARVMAFQRRRDLVCDQLGAIAGISCRRPEGAFYVFPSISDLLGKSSTTGRHVVTDQDFSEALLEETGVAVVFGTAFGSPGHFRISYATSDDVLTAAIERIASFVDGLS